MDTIATKGRPSPDGHNFLPVLPTLPLSNWPRPTALDPFLKEHGIGSGRRGNTALPDALVAPALQLGKSVPKKQNKKVPTTP